MNSKSFILRVNRDAHKRVSGFTLMGVSGDVSAQAYCLSFPIAQRLGKGEMVFEGGGKIVFSHGGISQEETGADLGALGVSDGGVLSVDVSFEDETGLAEFLERIDERQLKIRPEITMWGTGFTLCAK
ncbi:MAG: hypothetical protein WCW36_02400 [Candidatus Paceibacterota bacterium]|jgi:hypothetical protein